MPKTTLVVNADGPEIRVAVIEDGLLGELYIERKRDRGIAGNIYKGRVERILPGMQAAFVNIGLEKSAYLHVSDVRGTPDDLHRLMAGDAGEQGSAEVPDEGSADEPDAAAGGDAPEGGAPSREAAGSGEPSRPAAGGRRIEDLLKEGQEIVVQITKEPISTKGARVTRFVSLPGRHLVFMPTVDSVGISRKIGSDRERRRLREIIDEMRPPGSGFIVRTVASGVPEKDLRADMGFLIKLWNQIVQRSEVSRCPSLIYSDLDLLLRTVRDLFTPAVERMIIDSRTEYDRVKKFIAAFMPDFQGQIDLHEGKEPIFDGLGIELEIDRALERKVWLKSGGYLVIDETEALTAIDINTGRFVGKKSLEDTITQTNLEACQEIADQLKIRSIGGMIVVDFIDMDRASNRDRVMRAFNEALKRDRNRPQVSRISELGLVEMSRKRTRESLLHTLTEPCVHCEGKGYTKSRQSVCYEVLRELRRVGDMVEGHTIQLEVHPDVAKRLSGPDRDFLDDIEKRLQKQVVVKARGAFSVEEFEIRSPRDNQVLERSEIAHVVDRNERRGKRRKKGLGSPAEVEAEIAAEEAAAAINAESMADAALAEAEAQAARAAARLRQLDEARALAAEKGSAEVAPPAHAAGAADAETARGADELARPVFAGTGSEG